MNGKFGTGLFILVSTAVLSYGQAWALRARAGRLARHLIIWGLATFTMTGVASLILDVQHAPDSSRSRGLASILLVAGGLALVALVVGSRWGEEARRAPDQRSAALTLAGVHSAVVIGGGAVGVAVLLFLLLLGS
jgi:hypothetical protein